MQRNINKPIFIVGSPRSGTSVLTWCLGQHPNIFPVPESNWMGDFAVNVAIGYQSGAARGDCTILSAMDIREDELFAVFGETINDLILRHRKDLERKRQQAQDTSTASEPKGRWVDGTPEYSFHICGLRKLFPDALFVHILRDVRAVVQSMLNFHRVAGIQWISNEEKAYKHWLRSVRACIKAEQAYGPRVVYRIRYADLIDNPESAMRSLLDFLGEPYCAKCLQPLAERINSSNVPADFKADDPATDQAVIEKATRLCATATETPQRSEASPAAAEEMEAAFDKWVQYMATVESEYHREFSNTRMLLRLLDNVGEAAVRLGNSRRWRLVNSGRAIKAKLSRSKVSTGYDQLDKIVAAYSQWRASHPEIEKMDDPIELPGRPAL
jgi:Sulfotransferase family